MEQAHPQRLHLLRLALLATAFMLLAGRAVAQRDRMIPGPPADEYVDVTGDGRADFLITTRTIHVQDPQQPGLHGWHKLGVRTLSGTAVLTWSTPSTQRWYALEDSTRLDTALLTQRIHYQQLRWTDEDLPTEFWLLERPFGPAIGAAEDGWYGTGEHYEGSMVLRSVNERGTALAAFTFELPFPYGRVAIKVEHTARVPNGYGAEGDPVPTRPVIKDEFDFGHRPTEPQVIVPPGAPPDELVDITSDEIPDLVITGENAAHHASGPPLGTYHRGVRVLPGAALLMQKRADGGFMPFALRDGQELTPDALSNGLSNDSFRWAEAPRWSQYIDVLTQRYGSLREADEPLGWWPAQDMVDGAFVFRATQYGRPMIGCFEITYTMPGGELGVRLQGLVEEGESLRFQ